MKHVRRVYSNVKFEHGILTNLIFKGHAIGTFVKDGIIFHRCLITHVDRWGLRLSGRWLGMIPGDQHMDNFTGEHSFNLQNMEWKEEPRVETFYFGCRYPLQLPYSVEAEDELIIGRIGNPYAPELCPLR